MVNIQEKVIGQYYHVYTSVNIMASASLLSFVFALTFLLSARAENCDKNGVLLYEDIKCKSINEGNNSCPTEFDCNFSRPKSGCLFKGKLYQPGDHIESDLTYSSCQIGCFCRDTSIICAVLDCPEYFGAFREPGCYPEYKLGKCCASGTICASNSTEKTCQVDGETYKVGQKFYPKNKCLSCVCHENFTGEFDAETCQRTNCAAELRDADNIRNKCAAVYINFGSPQESQCCPNHWLCPDSIDKSSFKIEVIDPVKKEQRKGECYFGAQKIPVGEGLKTTIEQYGAEQKLVCECVVPPLLACKEV